MHTSPAQLCAEYGTMELLTVVAPAPVTVIMGASKIAALTIACLIFICFLSYTQLNGLELDLRLDPGESFR